MRSAILSTLAVFASFVLCAAARADSTLFIGTGLGTACQFGCAGDPNLIDPGSFDIAQSSPSGPSIPLYVVLAIPNATALSNSTIDGSTGSFVGVFNNPMGDIDNEIALEFPGAFSGCFSGPPPGLGVSTCAYPGAGLGAMQAADAAIGVTDTNGYAVETFFIGSISGGQLVGVNGENIPLGSFLFAFAPQPGQNIGPDGTPFTQAGLVTPEPGSLALLGTGLLSTAGILRRRRKA